MEHWWGPIISFLLAVITCLMGIQVRQISCLNEKLDEKVDEQTCLERHGRILKDQEGIWGALNNHSHTKIPEDARVIR